MDAWPSAHTRLRQFDDAVSSLPEFLLDSDAAGSRANTVRVRF